MSTGVKAGVAELKRNSVVTVIEKNGLQEPGGAAMVANMDGLKALELHSRDSLLCTSLEATLGEGDSYKWMLFLATFCYPFMHTLTLNCHALSFISRVVNGPLFARSLERLLRFDNFPSLRRIVVKSVCCVLFE